MKLVGSDCGLCNGCLVVTWRQFALIGIFCSVSGSFLDSFELAQGSLGFLRIFGLGDGGADADGHCNAK